MAGSVYSVGDIVLALNGSQLYLAKILKLKSNDDGNVQYLIHYQGWKSRWDEWLSEDKIHPDNDESRVLQGKLKTQASYEEKFVSREKDKRRDDDDTILRLNIPNLLQKHLLEEGVLLGPAKQSGGTGCFQLPFRPTVQDVLQEFLVSKGSSAIENQLLQDMTQGIIDYFDKALGMMLLYEVERSAYKAYRSEHPNSKMSEVYGTAHLLRLLVKLPLLLSQAKMGSESIRALQPRIQELLRYLEVHSDRLLTK